MTIIGTKVDETGTLIRDGGAFYLRRDVGGRYQLELQRTLRLIRWSIGAWFVARIAPGQIGELLGRQGSEFQ